MNCICFMFVVFVVCVLFVVYVVDVLLVQIMFVCVDVYCSMVVDMQINIEIINEVGG